MEQRPDLAARLRENRVTVFGAWTRWAADNDDTEARERLDAWHADLRAAADIVEQWDAVCDSQGLPRTSSAETVLMHFKGNAEATAGAYKVGKRLVEERLQRLLDAIGDPDELRERAEPIANGSGPHSFLMGIARAVDGAS